MPHGTGLGASQERAGAAAERSGTGRAYQLLVRRLCEQRSRHLRGRAGCSERSAAMVEEGAEMTRFAAREIFGSLTGCTSGAKRREVSLSTKSLGLSTLFGILTRQDSLCSIASNWEYVRLFRTSRQNSLSHFRLREPDVLTKDRNLVLCAVGF